VLWYKAWLETRGRFLSCLVTLTGFSFVFVHHAQEIAFRGDGLSRTGGPADYHRLLFVTQQFLAIMWVVSVVLLGMGGLIREKVHGVSTLTLSLAVSRRRLFAVRVAVGLVQASVLAVFPWCAVFLASSSAHLPIRFAQVLSYVFLLLGGGLSYFAMAILISSLVEGEYTAPAVGFGVVLLTAIAFDAWLRPYSLWRLITGDLSIDRSTYLVSPDLPWRGLLISLATAAAMLFLALQRIQKRDF
jgi:ABC-type transport system involved in multi-copper enzyme maturation permease subunit